MIKSKVIKKKADKKTKRIDHGINEENILARGPGRPSLAPAAAGHSDDSVDMFDDDAILEKTPSPPRAKKTRI